MALFALAAIALSVPCARPAAAHAFGQRYDLPVPLWLYLTGAGATVAVSLVLMALFVRDSAGLRRYPRIDLLRSPLGRALAHPFVVNVIRTVAVAVFVLIVVAGFLGNQSPIKNIAPTMVWVIWWVGMAYVSALVGDLWALINPWNAVFSWCEALYRRVARGRALSLGLAYPRRLGVWPSVALFVVYAWLELVWEGSEIPARLATLIVAYSLATWLAMFVFGREQWLARGEVFAIAFGLLARVAPLEVRVQNPAVCAACTSGGCHEDDGDCVNCHACFRQAKAAERQWNLRPHAVGLLTRRPIHPSTMVFVLLMLATVTYDGFVETPAWIAILDWLVVAPSVRSFLVELQGMGVNLFAAIKTAGLLIFPLLFLGAYFVFGGLIKMAVAGAGTSPGVSTGEICRLFVLSLIPIAFAYHLAHYLSFLMLAGQLVVPLASDPFGYGWNLLGTAQYAIDISVVSARMVWFTAVATIVAGHIVAVYLAHVMALRVFGDGRAALRSQYPMLVLMVGYTMISLWILAQPVVKT